MLPRAHGGLRRPDQGLASFRKPRVTINGRGVMVRPALADPRDVCFTSNSDIARS